MKHLVDLAMMDRLDHLIRRHATGTPHDLARQLKISQTTLNEYISYMKKILKAPIRYNAYISSYIYEYIPDFYLGFEIDHTAITN